MFMVALFVIALNWKNPNGYWQWRDTQIVECPSIKQEWTTGTRNSMDESHSSYAESIKSDQKWILCHIIPFTETSKKYKLPYRDRKQISGLLGMGGGEGKKEGNYQRAWGDFGGDGSVRYWLW